MIKIAIVEDQQILRESLAALINGKEGFRCTANFETMEEAIQNLPHNLPDVLLVDIGLPKMSGIEGIRILKKSHPELLCVVLTIYEDDDRIFEALCAGACGYLLKKTQSSKLVESIKEAFEGGAPMSPQIARRVVGLFQDFRPPEKADYHLTPHEVRLLQLMVEGNSCKTAGKKLGVSVNTISFHLRNIYQKLQVHSKSEAVAKALRNHVIK